VRRPKNKNFSKPQAKSGSPYLQVFSRSNHQAGEPEALKREISTPSQKNWRDGTIIYGEDNALPLRIAKAVDESPATKSCVETIAQFIKGSDFSDPELKKIKIDKAGTTLWDLHCSLADSLALFRGFSTNFKYNESGKIKIIYTVSFESCRFKQPDEGSNEINTIIYNPYYGTDQFKDDYSKEYPVFNIADVLNQVKSLTPAQRKIYPGQIYYYGKTSPLYRFYPVPDYWSAKKWIYIDSKIQEGHAENMDNGFFQSTLWNVIGDPNEWSRNPRTQEEYTDPATSEKKTRPTKTVGEEFSEEMSRTFSGTKKMGSTQVVWSANKEQTPAIQAFPTSANADLFLALQDITTKNITIATRVPSILANISDGVSIGGDGNEIQKAVELMQSRTAEYRVLLENFYNEIIFPNLETPIDKKVSIVNFSPVSEPVTIDDKFWEVLTPEEKRLFVKKNLPGIEMIDAAVAPGTDQITPPSQDQSTVPDAPVPTQANEALKDINMQQLNRILKIVGRFNIGKVDPTDKTALSYEQAKSLLLSYGLTDNDIPKWLITDNEV
jgi:hypothetical protein